MKYFVGVDGGGSKTIFGLCDEKGHLINSVKTGSTSYQQYGHKEVFDRIKRGIEKLIGNAHIKFSDIGGACFGMPCFGEKQHEDMIINKNIESYFKKVPFKIVNDAEVGWAGSLMLKDGINIVAGTGSIAFGRDKYRNTARSGGWSEYIGDEGSGYYLGKKLLELFTKQADGRLPKGVLYLITREKLGISNDYDIIDLAKTEFVFKRDKMAALQIILSDAAKAGDISAIEAYSKAGKELALSVLAVRNKLAFDTHHVSVSYSGGIFNNGELVLKSFREILCSSGCRIENPQAEPYIGAILLAVESFGAECLNEVLINTPRMGK